MHAARQGFLPHLLSQLPGVDSSPLVQVLDKQGVLLPRSAIVRQGDEVQVWCAGSAWQGVGIGFQSMSLPADVKPFLLPSLAKGCRLRLLQRQGIWISDDQMKYGLDAIAQAACSPVQVIDPLVAQRCSLSKAPAELRFITAFTSNGHWVTMWWRIELGRVTS